MTPEEEAKAREIFKHPGRVWTPEESKFLEGLFKRRLRAQLKKILDEVRAEFPLDNSNLETENHAV